MKILATTDGSKESASAISLCHALFGLEGHEFVLLSISDARDVAMISSPVPGAVDLLLSNLDQAAREALNKHSRLFQGAETVELLHRQGAAAETILRMAEEVKADLIVLGSRGLGPLSGPLLGSVSHRVAAHCQCSVLLGRTEEPNLSDGLKIMLGVDGSPQARDAIRLLSGLSFSSQDEILCVQVLTLVQAFRQDVVQKLSPFWAQEKELAQQNLTVASSQLQKSTKARIRNTILEGKSAGEALADRAQQDDTDLIVVGNRGLGALDRFLLGSVSTYLLHAADCGLLIVKPEDDTK